MPTLKMKVLIALFGLVFLGVGALLSWQAFTFFRDGEEAAGKVIDVRSSRDSEGDRMYAAVIEFVAKDGTTHEFTSDVETSWSPKVGEEKTVLYRPDRPDDAMEKSVLNMVVFPGVFIGTGVLILILGLAVPYLVASKRRKKEQRLRSSGRPIQARITGSERTGFEVNRQPYFAVTAQWLDTTTNTMRLFRSHGLPYDPTSSLEGRSEVTVYVNPSDPADYWMDVSFLPKAAA
ncbi:DUF3592 domain-containing protein [Candidatus Uhrbacteria bacterium]|nr:DUF3592 domain-containing protein [Candidatus Uhrbacteria bacterium]